MLDRLGCAADDDDIETTLLSHHPYCIVLPRRHRLAGKVRIGLMLLGKRIPRQGYSVKHNGETVGVVTSGTFSPTLDVGIGMAYLPAAKAVVGSEFEIDVRGKHRRARVAKRPLLKV